MSKEEAQAKRLRDLASKYTVTSREYNKQRRWNGDKTINLAHIRMYTKAYSVNAPKYLLVGLEYFIARYITPHYEILPTPTTSRILKYVLATIMYCFNGYIQMGPQLGTYLIYNIVDRKAQFILRDRPKVRAQIYLSLQDFHYQYKNKSYSLFGELLVYGNGLYKKNQDKLTLKNFKDEALKRSK